MERCRNPVTFLTIGDFMPAHRINAVKRILIQEKWRKNIDKVAIYSCGTLELFEELDYIEGIADIMVIDSDDQVLQPYKDKIIAKKNDLSCQKGVSYSLRVGHIGEPDSRVQGVGVVIAIEVIQHVFPDVLEALPYNVFGFIKPKLAIFSTPNADFNVVFANMKGFRTDSHKFEWNRNQFESWARNICVRFPRYRVYFQGVGVGLHDTQHLGCCTQMAIFERIDFSDPLDIAKVPLQCRIRRDMLLFDDDDEFISGIQSYSHGICTYCSCTRQTEKWEYRSTDSPPKSKQNIAENPNKFVQYVNRFGNLEIWCHKYKLVYCLLIMYYSISMLLKCVDD